jgi:hypothetical protein
MTIDGREELENVFDSILRNNESDSIETDERKLQPWKQEEPIISTVRGMKTISSRPKYRIRIERSKLCRKLPLTVKSSKPYYNPISHYYGR